MDKIYRKIFFSQLRASLTDNFRLLMFLQICTFQIFVKCQQRQQYQMSTMSDCQQCQIVNNVKLSTMSTLYHLYKFNLKSDQVRKTSL